MSLIIPKDFIHFINVVSLQEVLSILVTILTNIPLIIRHMLNRELNLIKLAFK